MANHEEISQVLETFAKNYDSDGFIAFDDHSKISFLGAILVNYRGLRLIRFKKSQLSQFDQEQFKQICHQIGNSPEKREELFHALKEAFKHSCLCVLNGSNFKVSGELAAYSQGNLSAFLF